MIPYTNYSGEAAKAILRNINKQYEAGLLNFDHDRDRNADHYIAVTDGDTTYTNCRETIDNYRDLDGNLVYTVWQYLDKTKGYYKIYIHEYENGFIRMA